ncbi:RPA-interacting protein [Tiliqua scincoides]|uniref:RPA-interacting protein n=1 Tax=Tiliqua scincoides TaxID=71010 RepID=UPI003462E59B
MEAAERRRSRRAPRRDSPAPPWKETYRQRCMERLRNSRARLLDRYRQVGENVASGGARSTLLVQEVMEVEWRALQSAEAELTALGKQDAFSQMPADSDELAVLEEVQQELILQEQLAIEEYERSLQFDEECLNVMLEGFNAGRMVICPVCRRNNLIVKSHLVVCQCGLYIGTQGMTEEKLQVLLEDVVTEHSHQCQHSPEFAITGGTEGESNLLMSCQVCDSWVIVL